MRTVLPAVLTMMRLTYVIHQSHPSKLLHTGVFLHKMHIPLPEVGSWRVEIGVICRGGCR